MDAECWLITTSLPTAYCSRIDIEYFCQGGLGKAMATPVVFQCLHPIHRIPPWLHKHISLSTALIRALDEPKAYQLCVRETTLRQASPRMRQSKRDSPHDNNHVS